MNWLTNAIIPRWMVTLGVLILCASAWGGFYYWAYSNGVDSEHERNVAADNTELAKIAQHNFELQTKVRDIEHQNVIQQTELVKQYEKRIDDAKATTGNLIHRVESGAVQLRIATKDKPNCSGSSTTVSAATTTANQTTAELSSEASRFLINLTDQCDATAEKLNLCIDIAESDRKANSLNDFTLGSEVQPATGSVSSNSFDAALTNLNESHGSAAMSTSIDLTNKEISNEIIK